MYVRKSCGPEQLPRTTPIQRERGAYSEHALQSFMRRKFSLKKCFNPVPNGAADFDSLKFEKLTVTYRIEHFAKPIRVHSTELLLLNVRYNKAFSFCNYISLFVRSGTRAF